MDRLECAIVFVKFNTNFFSTVYIYIFIYFILYHCCVYFPAAPRLLSHSHIKITSFAYFSLLYVDFNFTDRVHQTKRFLRLLATTMVYLARDFFTHITRKVYYDTTIDFSLNRFSLRDKRSLATRENV